MGQGGEVGEAVVGGGASSRNLESFDRVWKRSG